MALGKARAIGRLRDRCRALPELAAVERARAALRLLDLVFDARLGAPLVEHAGIAEAVGPAHAGRVEFLPAGADRLGRRVDLEGIERGAVALTLTVSRLPSRG